MSHPPLQPVSRTAMVRKNVTAVLLMSVLSLFTGFVSRKIFLDALGETLLGVNGLFVSLVGVLSFAELGLGTAMNFSLYRPVAQGDRDAVCAYMRFYKNMYRFVALAVLVLGLCILPFLTHLVTYKPGETPIETHRLQLYFLFFLLNTVVSYFMISKFSLTNAEQKSYIATYFEMALRLVITAGQIVVLVVYKNFLWYLLLAVACTAGQKLFIMLFFHRKYRYLETHPAPKLSKEDLRPIKQNILSLGVLKISEVLIANMGVILTSPFEGTVLAGVLYCYNLIIQAVATLCGAALNGGNASIGNLIITADLKKLNTVYREYRYVALILFGGTGLCMYFLLTPLVRVWLGPDTAPLGNLTLALIMVNHYMTGQRFTSINVKHAAGVFKPDRVIAPIQTAINLAVSIVLVNIWGMPGIFIGTVAQSIYGNIAMPYVVHKYVLKTPLSAYFKDAARFVAALLPAMAAGVLLTRAWPLHAMTLPADGILSRALFLLPRMAGMVVALCGVFAVTLFLLFRRDEAFQTLLTRLKRLTGRFGR